MGKRIPPRTTSILYRVIGPILAGMLAVTGLFTSARPALAADELSVTYEGDDFPAVVGQLWSRVYSASGGTGPYNCSLSGTIPDGLTFKSSTCTLSGTPKVFGIFNNIVITFTDSSEQPKTGTATITEMRVEAETETNLEIRSGHPDGSTRMVGYPVWVQVDVQYQSSDLWDEHPTGTVTVTSGAGGPTCSIELENGEGECALVFDSAASKTITASYPKTGYARGSSDSETITVQPLSVTPMLSAGRNHTCYLASDGMMSCWGNSDAYPVDEEDIPIVKGPYTKISSGDSQTCGLKLNGAIECWGENLEVTSKVPAGTYVDLSSGEDHVCAINNVNKLSCWGQVKAGSTLLTHVPTAKVTAVSAGTNLDCAILKSNGKASCWGQDVPEPTESFLTLAVGVNHACGVTTAGSLRCWGSVVPEPPTGTVYKAIGSGSNYSCAQKNDNTLTCWGSGAPVTSVSTELSQFSSGIFHTCAVEKTGGTLSCWDPNINLRAPSITLSPTSLPQYLPLGEDFSQSITADGGNAPYTFSIVSGSLTSGLSLTSDGLLSGTPANSGNLSFTVAAKETYPNESPWPLELTPGRQAYSSTVYDPATTTTLTLPAGPINAGSAVAAKATVTRVHATQPPLDGSVVMTSSDGEATCRAEVVNGTAECNLYFSTPGLKSVTAAFVDSDAYDESTSSAKTITIEPVEIDPVVSAGGNFSCSIDSSGFLTCWGRDANFQVSSRPLTGGFLKVSLGDSFACALGLNRQVRCWGWNGYGVTDPPPAITNVTQLATGTNHACALLDTGVVKCWGDNGFHQLDVPYPGTGNKYIQITAGANHTCGLTNNDSIRCWGSMSVSDSGSFAQLAAGGSSACVLGSDGMPICWGSLPPSGGPYAQLTLGENFACGLKSDSAVACWGGLSETLPGPFEQIAAGKDHACGILQNGDMQCWGGNGYGQAPIITISPNALPTVDVGDQYPSTEPLAQIIAQNGRSGTYNYSASSLPPGLVLGSNDGKLTGTLTQAGVYNFTVIAKETGFDPAIAAARDYSLTVRGRVNAAIDSALPANVVVGRPVQVSFSVQPQSGDDMGAAPTGTVTVTADDNECIVNLVDGAGSCTMLFSVPGTKTLSISYPGDGLYQPGQGSMAYDVVAFSQPEQIRTGGTRTYIYKANGTVDCLGGNCETESLSGTFTRFEVGADFACGLQYDAARKGEIVCKSDQGASAPVFTSGPYIDLSVGAHHACALKPDGAVECQGDNSDGQTSPPAGSFASLSAGGDHTCALNAAGEATCWGARTYASAGPFKILVSGDGHTCGMKNDNSVFCWGDNTYGQSAAPDSPAAFAQIAAGGKQTCGLDAEGLVTCWGDDEHGQSSPAYGNFIAVDTAGDHTCALRELGGSAFGFTCWGAASEAAPQFQSFSPLTKTAITVFEEFFHPFFPPGSPKKPKQASVFAGTLPPGICSGTDCGPGTIVKPQPGYAPQDLSGSGMNLYGTPTVPGNYEFAIQWTEDSIYPLILEQPYWLTVTGGDLSVDLSTRWPGGALQGMAYGFDVVVTNHTAIAVPDVVLTLSLPDGFTFKTSNLPVCGEPVNGKIECSLGAVDPGTFVTIQVDGLVTLPSGGTLNFDAAVVSENEAWPEINADDNSDHLSVPVSSRTVVFDEDFENLSGVDTAPSGEKFILREPSGNTTLNVLGLPDHKSTRICFDLYVIGNWLGNNPGGAPSLWSFGEEGAAPLIETSFSNDPAFPQAYPGRLPNSSYPARTLATGIDRLGYTDPDDGSQVPDSRYRLCFQFSHTGDALDLVFNDLNLPAGATWGFDNLLIEIGNGETRVFLPMVIRAQ